MVSSFDETDGEPGGIENNLQVNEAILIQLMRNYDVLMAVLTKTDRGTADALLEVHKSGRTLGPLPYWTLDEGN